MKSEYNVNCSSFAREISPHTPEPGVAWSHIKTALIKDIPPLAGGSGCGFGATRR
jgi:hypothetical protein